jgi:pimeloyl-ACP methyl ester carboxylesterase
MLKLLLFLMLLAPDKTPVAPKLETKFLQVYPQTAEWGTYRKSKEQRRAVVLVHGLMLHPLNAEEPHRAKMHIWQQPGSPLVTTLGTAADVYAFAYSQNVPVEEVAHSFPLRFGLRTLRAMGYEEIILIGHSAGGLVCRILMEDCPEQPVSKVIQIATPNAGSTLARAKDFMRAPQEVFLGSLTKKHRAGLAAKPIPSKVQFLCIICNGAAIGDGLVSTRNQWPNDLQDQGIPVQVWSSSHAVMRSKKSAEKLRDLLDEDFPRWTVEEVEAARKKLWWMGKKTGS